MRDVVYWQTADRLVYFDEKATAKFWDSHWQADGEPPVVGMRHDVVAVSGKYLARGSRILEGGCGRANKLKAMADAGFSPIGIDFAPASCLGAKGPPERRALPRLCPRRLLADFTNCTLQCAR